MSNSQSFIDISRVLNSYFDGLYNSDAALLGDVFQAGGQLATVTDGTAAILDVARWLDMVAKRESPASRKEPRMDQIVSIEFGSQTTALAKVQCAIGPKLFTDFLSLVLTTDGWRIVAKVYEFEPIAQPAI